MCCWDHVRPLRTTRPASSGSAEDNEDTFQNARASTGYGLTATWVQSRNEVVHWLGCALGCFLSCTQASGSWFAV